LSGRRIMTVHSTSRLPTTIREEMTMARDPIHPGKFLADELEALDMSIPKVAEVLHVPANRIYQLLKGQRALTADTALRLSQWLGTSAEMWLNLQKLYELRLAEQIAGEKIKKTIVRRDAVRAA
jgi:antitoxin HigA-1